MPKNVKDQEYKGRRIQIRRDSAWVAFVDGILQVSGQRTQVNALNSAKWLIDNNKI